MLGIPSYAQRGGPPPSPKASAPVDLTGYWVSLISNSEQWLVRMMTPAKGDFKGINLNPEGRKVASAWDPAADEAAGEQCKAYGAPGIMQAPGHLHITWDGDQTLRVEIDAGRQTRLLRFGAVAQVETQPASGDAQWQGVSTAQWEAQGGRGTEGGGAAGMRYQGNSLKVVTTNIRPGYVFKNGIPYSGKAVLTEYFSRIDEPAGDSYLLVFSILDDPRYFTDPFVRPWTFRKLPDGSQWNPAPCTAR